ncbi:hypothetical protein WG902_03765 [Ramlibacter sp. PS3R-8]|uniref:hypothetical protein n=1 Tax=Ramlibacter sp. PS3R-8 TaxID=3133437 RepID=UPI0030ACAFD9
MSKKAQAQQQGDDPLSTEGFALSIGISNQRVGPEFTVAQINMDLAGAPAPARKFVSDGFSVRPRPELGMVRMLFFQSKLDGSPRALLDVHLTAESLRDWIRTNAQVIPPDGFGVAPSEITSEPEQSVSMAANFLRVGSNPNGASVDFYYASPVSLQRAIDDRVIRMEPVVRVQMPPQVFAGIMRSLHQYSIGTAS